MSVFDPMAVPSRVWAVYHYLLNAEGQQEKRSALENRLSPVSLRGKSKKAGMLKSVLRATINMGLAVPEEGEVLRLNPALPPAARKRSAGRESFPATLHDLFFQTENTANHPLGKAIAWILAQDPYDMKPWSELQADITLRHLLDQNAGGADEIEEDAEPEGEPKVGVNEVRWAQLKYWSLFLGFAWLQPRGSEELLIPDPTVFLRARLPEIFRAHNIRTLPLPDVLGQLGSICPLLEGGTIRTEMEKVTGGREPQTLSRSGAFALLRLDQEGRFKLTMKSDADVWQFPEQGRRLAYSHMTWSGPDAEGAE